MAGAITEDTTHVVFSNPLATFKLKKANAASEVLTISKGDNIITPPVRFAAYHDGSTLIGAQSVSYTSTSAWEGRLSFAFSDGQVLLRCQAYETHFSFELLEIGGGLAGSASQILIARVRIDGEDNSDFAGIIYRGGYVVSELALEIETHIICTSKSLHGISPTALPAALEPTPRLPRLKVALLACPTSQWLALVEAVELQHDLPHPAIGGTWAKQHPDVHSSYLFVDITAANAAAVINYALRGGFKHIMAYVWTWSRTAGSYPINTNNYPSGLPDLRSVVTQVHDHGLKFGFHMLPCLISTADAYVSPIPTPRLAKESPAVLASIEQDPANPIQYIVHTAGLPAEYVGYFSDGENDIIIDNEIMTMVWVDAAAAELGVYRQRYDTPLEGHDPGAAIHHLPAYKGEYFFPDLRSNLLADIADNFANIYTDTNGDFAFLDGSETLDRVFAWASWFTSPLISDTFFRRLPVQAFLEGAGSQHNYQWHPLSRGASGDYAAIGVEAYMDFEKIGRFGRRYTKAFFPQELGWIGMLAKTCRTTDEDSFASTTLDEIEYQMNRALGHGLPIGLETRVADLQANGLTGAILDLIAKYEELRLSNYFPASDLEPLKRPDEKFLQRYQLKKGHYHLARSATSRRYVFRRRAYAEHLVLNGGGETWTFENPFPAQPLRMKITALPGHGGYTGPSLELANPLLDGFEVLAKAGGVECAIAGGQITATYTPPDADAPARAWCTLTKRFSSPLDLKNHKVIGLSVTGDGKGEVISIELVDNQDINRQYQFAIDFGDGTPHPRPVILPAPATKELFKYPYHTQGIPVTIKRSLRPFGYRAVSQINIHIKNIPEGSVHFSLGAIKALRQQHKALSSPACVVNGKGIVFATTLSPRKTRKKAGVTYYLEPWEYLAFNGVKFIKFDGNHQGLETGVPVGEAPTVVQGMNAITYRHEGANKALVSILLEDVPTGPFESFDPPLPSD